MRVVALDVGEVRVGVAVCDELEIAATPLTTLYRTGSLKRDIEAVARVIREQEAEAVVVGLPLSSDGGVGAQAKRIQGYGAALSRVVGLPLSYFDESLTSVEANELMVMQGVSRAKRREKIDQIAAALILEGYLRSRAKETSSATISSRAGEPASRSAGEL